MTKEFVKSVQRRLAALDLYSGKIDGIPGPNTEKGVAALFDGYMHGNNKLPTAGGVVVGDGTRLLPAEWLPTVSMDRIIVHWTAGSYVASSLDKEHYHFLIEGDGKVVKGLFSVAANHKISGSQYAAHTRNCNTGSIGVSMCCMAGAKESPFSAGNYPMTRTQWDVMVHVVAELCIKYGIAVTPKTVLSHAEVQPNLGIAQAGKWDFTRLAFAPSFLGAKACGDKMRSEVSKLL